MSHKLTPRESLLKAFREVERKRMTERSTTTIEAGKEAIKRPQTEERQTTLSKNFDWEFANHPTIKNVDLLITAIRGIDPGAKANKKAFNSWLTGKTAYPHADYLAFVAKAFGYFGKLPPDSILKPDHIERRIQQKKAEESTAIPQSSAQVLDAQSRAISDRTGEQFRKVQERLLEDPEIRGHIKFYTFWLEDQLARQGR